uniref:Integrin plexin domain n=1 Tax=Siphoviridae sp. ctv4j104 TaxID=2826510 RepID=A0A8S5MAM7_9CAUD|nr:MAG TPA: Integrin plexin domain [Siphoviridae sp. ctv4j104]
MTCKDCIHQAACLNWCRGFRQKAELCEYFSDKSEWFHFADKGRETAYYAVGYGNDARVIEEPIRGLAIIKNGLYCVIDECGDLYEIDKEIFLTKEEAEKDIERRKNR